MAANSRFVKSARDLEELKLWKLNPNRSMPNPEQWEPAFERALQIYCDGLRNLVTICKYYHVGGGGAGKKHKDRPDEWLFFMPDYNHDHQQVAFLRRTRRCGQISRLWGHPFFPHLSHVFSPLGLTSPCFTAAFYFPCCYGCVAFLLHAGADSCALDVAAPSATSSFLAESSSC